MNAKHRLQWVSMLAKLVAPMDAARAGKSLADMLPMFANLPDAAFTTASLDDIASQCPPRVPTYAELRLLLDRWWGKHDPTPRIAAPEPPQWRVNIPKPRDPPTEAELAAHGEVVRRWKLEIGYGKSRALAADDIDRPKPAVLSDADLLARCEAAGPAGTIRADMLRRKIAAEALKTAKPSDWKPYVTPGATQ